ncbi:MAG: Dabb family protein [Ilumatobacteraceae bacterium]|nr:Dabb family protein [Ilumatobacteraceae bacterium]
MIHHVVAFTWANNLPTGHLERVAIGLKELHKHLAHVIVSYEFGPDAALVHSGNADYGIVATFVTEDDWRIYDTDAKHNAVRAELFKPYISDRTAIQFCS